MRAQQPDPGDISRLLLRFGGARRGENGSEAGYKRASVHLLNDLMGPR